MGNQGVPGIQVWYTIAGATSIVNYEPHHVAKWVYQAQKANVSDYLLTDYSWMYHEDTYIRNSLVIGDTRDFFCSKRSSGHLWPTRVHFKI